MVRIGIGGRVGPLRGGISTRGVGVGFGPLSASTGYRRRNRRRRRRSGGSSGSNFLGTLIVAALIGLIWLVVVAWPVFLITGIATLIVLSVRSHRRRTQRRANAVAEAEREAVAKRQAAAQQDRFDAERLEFARTQTHQVAFAAVACDCSDRWMGAPPGEGVHAIVQPVTSMQLVPEGQGYLREDWYTHSVRHFGIALHSFLDSELDGTWFRAKLATDQSGYRLSVTERDGSHLEVRDVRLPDHLRLHLHSLIVIDPAGEGPVRSAEFSLRPGSRGSVGRLTVQPIH